MVTRRTGHTCFIVRKALDTVRLFVPHAVEVVGAFSHSVADATRSSLAKPWVPCCSGCFFGTATMMGALIVELFCAPFAAGSALLVRLLDLP